MSWIEPAELTAELDAALLATRARWEASRRSTAPADRPAAEAGVQLAYAAAGLAPPQQIIWCKSPIELASDFGGDIRLESAGANVKSSLVDGIVRSVARAVELSTSRAFRHRLWAEARLAVPSPLSRSIVDAVTLAIAREHRESRTPWSALRWLLRRRPAVRAIPFEDAVFSHHDGPPLGIYQCLHDAGGLSRETAPLRGLWQIAASCGWMAPHQTICWLTERPDIMAADDQGRLHAADGPALRFSDGWAHYAWKGVQIPSWLVEKKDLITVGLINRERDPVLRRCMIDIMTPARYIATSDAVCISRDDAGALWLKSWQHWDSWAAVEVVNGTPEPDGSYRQYVLQVPPTMRSAREAVAWTYGLTEHDYARLKLRT